MRTRSESRDTRGDSRRPIRTIIGSLGPGLVTGASDDDPSGIATYAQAGAQLRFGLLWTALVTFPLMAAVQEICDRTALATGRGLGALVAMRFGRVGRRLVAVLLVALFVANMFNIAADLVAVGSGMHLLHAGPAGLWAVVAGVSITLFVVSGSFDVIARGLKVVSLALLGYFAVLFFVGAPWLDVLRHTLVPHVSRSRDELALLVAVLGTTISPYLFFWQNAHRVEELREAPEGGDRPVTLAQRSRVGARRAQLTSRIDVLAGMAFSQLVMFSIIVATGATLGRHKGITIDSASTAAAALRPLAGHASSALFALGFVGSGVLAVPVLAGSGSAGLSSLFSHAWGFSRSPREAPLFYVLTVSGTIGGALMSLLGVNPISLLVVVAIVNGIAAAPFLVVIMLVASDDTIMGRYRNGRLASLLGWATAVLMTAASVALVVAR